MILFFPRYGREYTDPYLGHGIGPVPGYGVRLFAIKLMEIHLLIFKFYFFLGHVSRRILTFYAILEFSKLMSHEH